MPHILLRKIRLTNYFIFFFFLFLALATLLPKRKFDSGTLTLFSVNSFLYGFYISPILSGQKARIDELHKIVRAESNAIFSMVLFAKKFPSEMHEHIMDLFSNYLKQNINKKHAAAEKAYEELISLCVDYKGKDNDMVDKFLEKLVANQQNRTMFRMQVNNRVYSNEWMIILVLFSITLSFILLIDTGSGLLVRIVTALLCTGLSMLLMILMKLNTLTHKKATQVWEPFQTLVSTRYYRID